MRTKKVIHRHLWARAHGLTCRSFRSLNSAVLVCPINMAVRKTKCKDNVRKTMYRGRSGLEGLRHDLPNHPAMNISQSKIPARVAVSEPLVVDAEEVQNGCVQVVDV